MQLFCTCRPSGAKIIACINFSAWFFHVQLLHAIISGSGRDYCCQSAGVTSLQKCRLTKNYCYYQPLREQRRFHYRQHCAKRKAPVFNLLRGRFEVFRPEGRYVAPTKVKFGMEEGTFVPSSMPNFTPIGATIRV